MTHWLYPANTKFYDVLGAFSEAETYWPVNSKVAVGDVVYIYLAVPHKQIGFVCKVAEVDLEQDAVLEKVRPYFKSEPGGGKQEKTFMKLKVRKRITLDSGSPVELVRLKENGLSGMLMGPRKLENNPELLDYLKRNTK